MNQIKIYVSTAEIGTILNGQKTIQLIRPIPTVPISKGDKLIFTNESEKSVIEVKTVSVNVSEIEEITVEIYDPSLTTTFIDDECKSLSIDLSIKYRHYYSLSTNGIISLLKLNGIYTVPQIIDFIKKVYENAPPANYDFIDAKWVTPRKLNMIVAHISNNPELIDKSLGISEDVERERINFLLRDPLIRQSPSFFIRKPNQE